MCVFGYKGRSSDDVGGKGHRISGAAAGGCGFKTGIIYVWGAAVMERLLETRKR